MRCENSDVLPSALVAVALMGVPGSAADGSSTVNAAAPAASVRTVVEPM